MFAQDSEPIRKIVKNAVDIDDPVEAAHRYLAGDENIDTILCGIVKPSDISSNIEGGKPNSATKNASFISTGKGYRFGFLAERKRASANSFLRLVLKGLNKAHRTSLIICPWLALAYHLILLE